MELASSDEHRKLMVRDLRWQDDRQTRERMIRNRAEENAGAFTVYA